MAKYTVEVTKPYTFKVEFKDWNGNRIPSMDTELPREVGLYQTSTKAKALAIIADAKANGGEAKLA